MKLLSLILLVACIFFSYCRDLKVNNLRSGQVTVSMKNDTFCYTNFSKWTNDKIEILSACHVIFSDSVNKSLWAAYGGGSLREEYNVSNQSPNIYYTRVGDTINLKILHIAHTKKNRILPDTLFVKMDTVFLRERAVLLSDSVYKGGLKFEEFYYNFLVKRKQFNPIVRHIQ